MAKLKTRLLAASAAGAMCITVGSGALASAAPALDPPKPGTSSPKLDPQTPAAPTPAAPAPAPAPVQSEAPAREYIPGYVPLYADAPSKPMSNYDYGTDDSYSGGGVGFYAREDEGDPVARVVPEEIVAVVEAPRKMVRLGDFVAPQTNLLPERQWNMINNTFADLEAGYGSIYRSLGVEASRADRIAASTFGTAAAGAVVGAVPGAVAGALIGGTIGGNVGVAMGGTVTAPIAGVGAIPTGIVGTGIGAVAGAAIGGAVTAVPGALVGAAIGTATGAGDTSPDPIEIELPSRPEVDTEMVTAQTTQAVQQVSAAPIGDQVVEAVRSAATEAPKAAESANTAVRATIATIPGGTEAIAALDTFTADASMLVEPLSVPINEALNAAHTGLFD